MINAIIERSMTFIIEVQDFRDKISRRESKENLNTVILMFKKSQNASLYDKLWY